MRISDWSSDVCSSDLRLVGDDDEAHQCMWAAAIFRALPRINAGLVRLYSHDIASAGDHVQLAREPRYPEAVNDIGGFQLQRDRSEEHTSELQSLMRISYAVFCLKKKTTKKTRKII